MPSSLTDTHAHLNFKDYKDDLDQVIKRAAKSGIDKIICVSSNLEESEKAIEIAEKYPQIVYPAVGIHPQQTDPGIKLSPEKQIKKLTRLASKKGVIAIGKCGLDYSPAPPGEKDRTKKEQVFLFKKQIELAIKLKLPILIHSREAFLDTLQIIKSYNIQHTTNNKGQRVNW
jgi:TatD DNase family protein